MELSTFFDHVPIDIHEAVALYLPYEVIGLRRPM